MPTSKGSPFWELILCQKWRLVVEKHDFFQIFLIHFSHETCQLDWMMDDESIWSLGGLRCEVAQGPHKNDPGRPGSWDMPCHDPDWKCQQQLLRFGRRFM